jgi:hypothetical protein
MKAQERRQVAVGSCSTVELLFETFDNTELDSLFETFICRLELPETFYNTGA